MTSAVSRSGGEGRQSHPQVGDVAAQSLQLVARELQGTLGDAHKALEDFVQGQGAIESLHRCQELLHLAQGALRIVEVHGAALLAEEMEHVCEFLARDGGGANREEITEALSRAMVQLPAYLERVLAGGRDIALVLLPLLNDLRAARGRPLLSEGTLLLLNLSAERRDRGGEVPPRPEPAADLVDTARKVRPAFQLALLGLIRGEDVARNLQRLRRAATQLEQAASTDALYQFWWVVGGVLEALDDGGLDASVAIKRLLGQADRQIKRTIDDGRSRATAEPPLDLLNNLLYYVARARSSGDRVEAIRASFALSELLPDDDEVAEAREHLSGPSARLMQTVAAAIREDLARVKDVLDIHVRTGHKDTAGLAPQLEMLRKIADTLGVLGLGDLRGDVQGEVRQLAAMVEGGDPGDDATLLSIASTLLRVEDNLDAQLVRLVAPDTEQAAPADGGDADYQQVTRAVLRECVANLARVKDAVAAAVERSDVSGQLDEVPVQLRGVTAGLLMLGRDRAVRVVEGLSRVIAARLRPGRVDLDDQLVDRLADAIVSVEYYMETIAVGRSDPWYLLDNAEGCLELLQPASGAGEGAADAAADERPVTADDDDEADDYEPAAPAVMAPPEERIDPELLEVFIEEAKEELVAIRSHLPAWRQNSEDHDALIALRRSFHTLKGSGRMVGAQLIGEFCWSIENLLNRVINGTQAADERILDVLDEVVASLPQLIEQLEVGLAPRVDLQALMRRAEALAAGDAAAWQPAAEAGDDADDVADAAAPEPQPQMDPVLKEIFLKETREHLGTVRDFIAQCETGNPPFRVSDELYRACHTLLGSARMAGVEPGEALAAPMEQYVRTLQAAGQQVGADGLAALRHAVAEIQRLVDQLDADEPLAVDAAAVLAAFESPRAEAAAAVPADDDTVGAPHDVVWDAGDAAVGHDAGRPGTPAAADDDADEPRAEDFDPELAAIFTEEAAEILEQAEELVDGWQGTPGDVMVSLQRLLHTLKGGARMAGVVPMGDLSHAMETLLERVDAGHVTPGEPLAGLLRRSLDTLHGMRDAVSAGQMPGPEAALLTELTGLADGAARIPAPADVPASSAREEAPPSVAVPPDVPSPAAHEPTAPSVPEAADAGDPDNAPARVAPDTPESAAPVDDARADAAADVAPAAMPAASAPVTERPPDRDGLGALLAAMGAQAVEPPDDDDAAAAAAAAPDVVTDDVVAADAAFDDAAVDLAEDDTATQPAQQPPAPPPRPRAGDAGRQEFVRVDAELLDDMLNSAGEISIFHSRLNQQVAAIEFNLQELAQTASRMREQLRKLDAETERQILFKHQEDSGADADFDPLELDRYSTLQQLSRALAESVSDVGSINDLLRNLSSDADTLLVQQGRVTLQLQDSLMRTRMVPFQRHVARLSRLVRQAAASEGKRAELVVHGATGELDRQVLERMLPPLEHLLRNAVVHGIETPEQRRDAGKPAAGEIRVHMRRDGSEVVIEVADDGAGINTQAVRAKALERGLLRPEDRFGDELAMELILRPGFSTAGRLTQEAGRGVGLDVVASEVQKLGGSLRIDSTRGRGTRFNIRLPYTLAITQALIVRVGDETFALPLPTVEGIARIPRDDLLERLKDDDPRYDYAGESFRLQHLGLFVGGAPSRLPDEDAAVPVILVRAGEHSTALITDQLVGSREIVVKTLGPQITGVPGVSGATILGDGSIVVILDVGALVRARRHDDDEPVPMQQRDERILALVVDDSITVRRVTQRLLERNGMRVLTARDGMDAITVMQDARPDVILLDIEMPRMDGYQFATHVRNDPRVADVPIIMITSRSSEKHRARAIEVGVNDYLSKPYQESQLLAAITPLVGSESH